MSDDGCQARIALERRRFLNGATMAVRRQDVWSSVAHDMTAEYRSLCAEEVLSNFYHKGKFGFLESRFICRV
jgi:hypothetical protein